MQTRLPRMTHSHAASCARVRQRVTCATVLSNAVVTHRVVQADNSSKRRRPARQRNRSAAGGPRNNSRKSSPISFHSLPSPNRGSGGGGAGGGPGDGAGRHASHGRRSRRDSDEMRYISKRPAALDTRNPYDASTAGTRTAMSNHSTAADQERPYSAYNDEDSAALFQFHPTVRPCCCYCCRLPP